MPDISFEGFERFLKIIEDRFGIYGKIASTIFLAVVALAVLGLALGIIWTNIIVPAETFLELIYNSPANIAKIIFRFFIAFGNILLFLFFLPWFIYAFIKDRRLLKQVRKQKVEAEILAARANRHLVIGESLVRTLKKHLDKQNFWRMNRKQLIELFADIARVIRERKMVSSTKVTKGAKRRR